jgi:hypothetical protein
MFPYDTEFTFGSLTFAAEKDENLKLLTPRPAPERLISVYGQALYLSAILSTTGGAYSGLNPYAGPYIHTVRFVQGSLVGHLSSSHRLEHRALPHRQRSLIKTQLMTTPRSGEVPLGTLLRRATLSSWWPRLEHLLTTAPADIPPLGGQKRPMPGRPMMK